MSRPTKQESDDFMHNEQVFGILPSRPQEDIPMSSSPRLVHNLRVFEVEDKQWVQAVMETQPCGKIEGGGTTQQPLRIALSPLYAAAPDLLAACEAMLSAIEKHYPNDWSGTKSLAYVAVAKAKGQTP